MKYLLIYVLVLAVLLIPPSVLNWHNGMGYWFNWFACVCAYLAVLMGYAVFYAVAASVFAF